MLKRVSALFGAILPSNLGLLARKSSDFSTEMAALDAVSGRILARTRPSPVQNLAFDEVSDKECPPIDPKIWNLFDAGVRVAAQGPANIIEIYGAIGDDYWADRSITAKTIAAELRKFGSADVEVHINSPGGDMFEGIAIYNVLAAHPGNVTVKIMGLAASAASIIAMAGNTVKMGLGSFMMIHECWVMAIGNKTSLKEVADWLAPFDDALRDIYVQRTSQEEKKVEKWMKSEKMFSASDAIDNGFADEMLSADEVRRDDKASEQARALNEVRELEHILCRQGGKTRSQARAMISALKGMPGAAPSATQDAGDTKVVKAAQEFIDLLKSLTSSGK
jgi:ATP-dependent Clp protease, protease subunit